MKLASTDGRVTRTVVTWRRDLFGPLIEERLRPNDRYSWCRAISASYGPPTDTWTNYRHSGFSRAVRTSGGLESALPVGAGRSPEYHIPRRRQRRIVAQPLCRRRNRGAPVKLGSGGA